MAGDRDEAAQALLNVGRCGLRACVGCTKAAARKTNVINTCGPLPWESRKQSKCSDSFVFLLSIRFECLHLSSCPPPLGLMLVCVVSRSFYWFCLGICTHFVVGFASSALLPSHPSMVGNPVRHFHSLNSLFPFHVQQNTKLIPIQKLLGAACSLGQNSGGGQRGALVSITERALAPPSITHQHTTGGAKLRSYTPGFTPRCGSRRCAVRCIRVGRYGYVNESITVEIPSCNHKTDLGGREAIVGVGRALEEGEGRAHGDRERQDGHDGVGAGVHQPCLFERGVHVGIALALRNGGLAAARGGGGGGGDAVVGGWGGVDVMWLVELSDSVGPKCQSI